MIGLEDISLLSEAVGEVIGLGLILRKLVLVVILMILKIALFKIGFLAKTVKIDDIISITMVLGIDARVTEI